MLSIGETWFSIIRLHGNRPSRNSFQRREEWSNVDRAWKTHWRTIKAAKHSKVRSSKIDRRALVSPLPPMAFIGEERASRDRSRVNSRSRERGDVFGNYCPAACTMFRWWDVKTLTSSPVASPMESHRSSIRRIVILFLFFFLNSWRFDFWRSKFERKLFFGQKEFFWDWIEIK